MEFHVKPKADSKALQTDSGSQRCGTVESMKANIPSERSLVPDVEEVVLLVVMDCMPTSRSRAMSV